MNVVASVAKERTLVGKLHSAARKVAAREMVLTLFFILSYLGNVLSSSIHEFA